MGTRATLFFATLATLLAHATLAQQPTPTTPPSETKPLASPTEIALKAKKNPSSDKIISALPSRNPEVVLPLIQKIKSTDKILLLERILGPVAAIDTEETNSYEGSEDTFWRRYELASPKKKINIVAEYNKEGDFITLKIVDLNAADLIEEVIINNPLARKPLPLQTEPIIVETLPRVGENWFPKITPRTVTLAFPSSSQLLPVHSINFKGIRYEVVSYNKRVMWIETSDTAFRTPEGHTMQTPYGLFERTYGAPTRDSFPGGTWSLDYFKIPSGWRVYFDTRTSPLPVSFELGR